MTFAALWRGVQAVARFIAGTGAAAGSGSGTGEPKLEDPLGELSVERRKRELEDARRQRKTRGEP